MKAGEFQDKFGNIITIMGIDGRMSSCTGRSIGPTDPDWPAAKAALDALIAEQDAWVELNGDWRISTDGIKVQRRDWWDDSDPWVDTTEAPELVKLYRAGLDHGREVAHAEHEALREQVMALEGAVLAARECLVTIYGWIAIKEAAKAVQL